MHEVTFFFGFFQEESWMGTREAGADGKGRSTGGSPECRITT
jgi:hypothetical protein